MLGCRTSAMDGAPPPPREGGQIRRMQGKRGEHGRTWWPEAPFGCNSRGLVQGLGRGQGVTTAWTIGAVLRGETGAHVVCSDLR